MTILSHQDQLTISRILKVNHAGESGAIQIYRAQIFVSKWFYPDLVEPLSHMLAHEIEHQRFFRQAMPSRQARPCRAMWLWGLGGSLLGLTTALLGRNGIWACTEAVERTVHMHLEDQLRFTEHRDTALNNLIESIRVEEESHLEEAQARLLNRTALTRAIDGVVTVSTEIVIWLSTQGDSAKMVRSIKGD